MMIIRRLAFAGAAAAALGGCGAVAGGPAGPQPGANAGQGSTAEQPAGPLHSTFDFSRPINIVAQCDPPLYAGELTVAGLLGNVRGAAVVTLDAPGAARWNSSDGHRWTQAEADAAVTAAHGRFSPSLFTPWRLHVSGPVLRGTVPSSITAYALGGKLGADRISMACTTVAPVAGQTYLAEFGGELTTAATTGPLQSPVLAELIAYDPATRTAHTRYGPLVLPSAPG